MADAAGPRAHARWAGHCGANHRSRSRRCNRASLPEPRSTYAGRRGLTLRPFLAVPMLRGETPIGAIALFRKEVELFSDPQIELVKSFADQAVIAIRHARWLND